MHRLIPAVAWLGLIAGAASTLTAQAAGNPGSAALRRLVAELAPSARLRLASGGERWTGRLAARPLDSLTVIGRSATRTIPLSAIDTLWLRRENYPALAAGAGFGALMFGLLQLGNGGDRSAATKLGAILFLGAAGGGLVIDAASNRWSRRYPER